MTPQPTPHAPLDLSTLYRVWAAVTARPGSLYALDCGVTGPALLDALLTLNEAGYIVVSFEHVVAVAVVPCAVVGGAQ
jgi:hypothetical protein